MGNVRNIKTLGIIIWRNRLTSRKLFKGLLLISIIGLLIIGNTSFERSFSRWWNGLYGIELCNTHPKVPKESAVCDFPKVSPFDPSVYEHFKRYPPLKCSGLPSLVYHKEGYLIVNRTKTMKVLKKNVDFKGCAYAARKMKPETDFDSEIVYISRMFKTSIQLRPEDSDVMVKCVDSTEAIISKSYLSIIRRNSTLVKQRKKQLKKHKLKKKPAETLNVIFIGLDATSRGNFIRSMPKTRKFLKDKLNALEYQHHHIVGYGTIHNVMALLTGRHFEYYEGDSPEFGKWNWDTMTFDKLTDAFVYRDYEKAGYFTCYTWEQRNATAFHYKKRGWTKRYVDFTNRANVVASWDDKQVRSENGNCVGDMSEIELHANYLVEFAQTFNRSSKTPYFGYVFFNNLTHDDPNRASSGDVIFEKIFKTFHDKNLLHNTLLVFFSDHGQRFGNLRSSYAGMVEHRSPILYLVFPDWFYKKYPKVATALKRNQERLTTPFDVYSTIKHLLYFNGSYENTKAKYSKYGISFFQKIPVKRTCTSAGIPLDKCLCFAYSHEEVFWETGYTLGFALKNHILTLIRNVSDQCEELHLETVKNVLEIGSSDSACSSFYQVTIVTTPGNAIYEAILTLTAKTSARVVGEVTRLNMYRGQADCIENPTLQQFCYCSDLIKKKAAVV